MSPPAKKLASSRAETVRVILEQGRTWVFAAAIDWPGWCRRGRGEQVALDTLADYLPRYRAVVGRSFRPGPVEIVGRVKGTATTDFGAPDVKGPWDDEPLDGSEAGRLAGLLERCWKAFDAAVAGAPAVLPKGPRGGGRDREAMVDHVREAERTYVRRSGVHIPPRTSWAEQRAAFTAHIRGNTSTDARWPLRYVVRRSAWHVLDHAWELQDKSA